MPEKVWIRRDGATGNNTAPSAASPIPSPPTDPNEVKEQCDSFTLESFTAGDAWHLGHLLYARLSPLAAEKPTVISIATANSSQLLFHCVVGSGTAPDNEVWVRRKRNTVLRWGCSTWLMHCKFDGDEGAFQAKYGINPEQTNEYAIHGGGVPIRVRGVEGVVAVVVVSGLKQHEDHGVIVDVIRENWK